jgi:hypothetical protein
MHFIVQNHLTWLIVLDSLALTQHLVACMASRSCNSALHHRRNKGNDFTDLGRELLLGESVVLSVQAIMLEFHVFRPCQLH